ncbi:hypothetical protein ACWGR4_30290 [Embleya sp. NPDC055664]
MAKATVVGTVVREDWVEVSVTADDQDTFWALDCQSEETFDRGWREEFAMHVCRAIGKHVHVHVHVIEDFEIDHGPGRDPVTQPQPARTE